MQSIVKVFAIVLLRSVDGSRLYSKYFLRHFGAATL